MATILVKVKEVTIVTFPLRRVMAIPLGVEDLHVLQFQKAGGGSLYIYIYIYIYIQATPTFLLKLKDMQILRSKGDGHHPSQWEGHDGHLLHFDKDGGHLLHLEVYMMFVDCSYTLYRYNMY